MADRMIPVTARPLPRRCPVQPTIPTTSPAIANGSPVKGRTPVRSIGRNGSTQPTYYGWVVVRRQSRYSVIGGVRRVFTIPAVAAWCASIGTAAVSGDRECAR